MCWRVIFFLFAWQNFTDVDSRQASAAWNTEKRAKLFEIKPLACFPLGYYIPGILGMREPCWLDL